MLYCHHGRGKEPQQRHHSVDYYGRFDRIGDLLVQEIVVRGRFGRRAWGLLRAEAQNLLKSEVEIVGRDCREHEFGGDQVLPEIVPALDVMTYPA